MDKFFSGFYYLIQYFISREHSLHWISSLLANTSSIPMKTPLIVVCLLLVWLASCIKDPACPPTPSNKGWLISQVTEISFRSQSHTGTSTGSYQKTVHDIYYDAFNKPVIRLTAESPENDTSNLRPAYIDSLTYDGQQRMIEIRRY